MKTTWELFCHQKQSKVAIALRPAGGRPAGRIAGLAKHRFWLSILTVLIMLSSHRGVQAAEILRPIATFTGMLDSFDFDVPSELVGGMMGTVTTLTTGPITLSLDPAGGVNLFGLDDTMDSGSIDVTLLVDFPLLFDLGMLPPLSIRIMEGGAASVMDCMGTCPPNEFTFTATMSGGGTVADGSFFDGTIFSNLNQYLGEGINSSWFAVTPPDITWSLGFSGEVTFPANLGGDMVTGIDGSGTLTLIPEPAAVTLFLLGLLGLVGHRQIARRMLARRHLH